MDEPLKPCPFCGSADNIRQTETDGAKWGAISCGCGAVGPDVRTQYGKPETWRDDAVREWNRRFADSTFDTELCGLLADAQHLADRQIAGSDDDGATHYAKLANAFADARSRLQTHPRWTFDVIDSERKAVAYFLDRTSSAPYLMRDVLPHAVVLAHAVARAIAFSERNTTPPTPRD